MAIIATPESNIVSDISSFASAEFSIRTDAAMFDVFRSRIYSDVILAPIRELSTNAIDACIESDRPIQWDVHIPTLSEPYFSVRDYGGGLPLDFLAGDFCVLGTSTKRNSNLTNGQFGLGRLSSLAYAQSCTVESFIDGMHHSYMLTIQEGIPILIHLSSVSSTELSGARFNFAVKPADIQEFHRKAADLYKYFEYKPNTNIELPEVKVHLNHDNFMLTDDNLGIVMGNVYYPIRNGIRSAYSNLILKVPIGKVALTPGRESLNYDEATISYLRDYIAEAEEELIVISNAEIAAQPTDFARLDKFNELYIKTPWASRNNLELPSPQTACIMSYDDSCPVRSPLFNVTYKHTAYKNTFSPTTRHVNNSFFFKATYFLADRRQFLHAVNEIGGNIVIFRPIDSTPEALQNVIDFLEAFGITDYEKASDYDHIATTVAKPKSVDIQIRRVTNGYVNSPESYRTSDATLYYIPLNGTSVESTIPLDTLAKIFKLLYPDTDLYGIAKTHLTKVAKIDTCINFLDYLRDTYDESTPLEITYGLSIDTKGYDGLYSYRRDKMHTHPQLPLCIKLAFDVYKQIQENPFRDLSEDARTMLQQHFNCTFTQIIPPSSWSELKALYPLLDEFDSLSPDSLTHYFKLEEHYATVPPAEG